MWNQPSAGLLSKIPRLYQTEKTPLQDKTIYLHFFLGSCDWYIAEFDGDDLMWGFAILGGDTMNAEWGYISLSELKAININGLEVDRDIYWKPQQASSIDKICQCNGF
ncbi:MAG: DUF2958 domain-containing protein [Deltaproteobacteria bacterium]|nr:DUF2958 domain-containing protein [Deltaproteobacteria bacterium]